MDLPTAPSQLDYSIAAEEIPEELRCTDCGRKCEGPPIRRGGDERICSNCFRNWRKVVVIEEYNVIPPGLRVRR